ncbi:Crp/Fnr family transcriptional regulator [Aureicoccus marinus]|jgi:CRP-like cAMP-binding protein|uniref:Crp/Fnr family transcriptional regulator n=1 Tax=Aureicoccus marinus TaxID=754435 RepID=A0A2S7T914_9FLAO|nr:Crp/Fnr family transcriptional regulator [Aureicoccus marinus]PQJ15995.1 Crp/Fnr family transcriptional regulator [Aureicoccus marinus]
MDEHKCENCIIRQFNALRAMNKDELKQINKAKEDKSFKKGEVLFKEGETLHGLYCLKNGVAKLSKLSENGKDQIVKLAAKGSILGHRSVIAKENTNLSAVAVSDVQSCYIPKSKIEAVLRSNPDFTLEMLRKLAHDIKESDDSLVQMSQKNVKQRMAQALLHIQENFGADEEGYFSVHFSREDLANIVGTATESAIRMLSEFKKDTILKSKGRKLGIADLEALKKMAAD